MSAADNCMRRLLQLSRIRSASDLTVSIGVKQTNVNVCSNDVIEQKLSGLRTATWARQGTYVTIFKYFNT